ncbi:uncharacterized protein LOC136075292 [Hydra vulgaris]|uniref:Uncharacterized protein LOC136075292 n=1 Tax=Hydra vulgaris TaxID=6087 RepID=A0ABM4B573_HYDVU
MNGKTNFDDKLKLDYKENFSSIHQINKPFENFSKLKIVFNGNSTYSMLQTQDEDITQPSMEEITQPSMEEITQPSMEEITQPSMEEITQPSMEEITQPSMEEITQPSMEDITQPLMEEITGNSEKILCDEINKDENQNVEQKLIPTLPFYDDANKQEKNRKISLAKRKQNKETQVLYTELKKEEEFVLIASEVVEKVDFEDKVEHKSAELSYSLVDNNSNIISVTDQNNKTQNPPDDQDQRYNNKKYNTFKTNGKTNFSKKVVNIDHKSPFTNARLSMVDDTSSSVITADEVVKRRSESSLNLSSPYPLDAEQLSSSQLTFLQEKLGEEDRVSQHFKKQFTLKETDNEFDGSPIVHPVQNDPVLTVGEIRAKVEQIVSLKNISDTEKNKIVELKQIEKEHYKLFIQQLAYKKTQEELKDLVEVLSDLGYLTTKLGELSGELKYFTDAAVFYQYVITILNEKLTTESKNSFFKQELTNPYQKLTDIQELIFTAIDGE